LTAEAGAQDPDRECRPTDVVEAIRRYRGQRGPQQTATKELISLRVDRDVLDALRATGRGWQTRANEALLAYARQSGLRAAPSSRRTKRTRKAAPNARNA
jgi:uncharacterized protein (DUF4415 family)